MDNNDLNEGKSFLSFSLTLAVRGDNLDLDSVSSTLGISPSSVYKSSGAKDTEKQDAWYYKVKAKDIHEFSTISKLFFQSINKASDKLSFSDDITLRIILHIHSDIAQVYFDLPEDFLNDLSQCNIPFGISILDWGLVEN
jgi:hypothetical protein